MAERETFVGDIGLGDRLQHLAHHQFVNDPVRDPDISQLQTSGHWLPFPLGKFAFVKELLKQLWLPNLFRFIVIRAKYNATGTDKNPYGTVRFFVHLSQKAALAKALAALKQTPAYRAQPIVSHSIRRVFKYVGAVPTGSAILSEARARPNSPRKNSRPGRRFISLCVRRFLKTAITWAQKLRTSRPRPLASSPRLRAVSLSKATF